MPKPHSFATAPATKGRTRAVPKPSVTVYGYARVSTGGQSVDAQARQLRASGAGKVFCEVASGAKTNRPQLARLVSELAAGDHDGANTWRRIPAAVVQPANTLPTRTTALIGTNPETVTRLSLGFILDKRFSSERCRAPLAPGAVPPSSSQPRGSDEPALEFV